MSCFGDCSLLRFRALHVYIVDFGAVQLSAFCQEGLTFERVLPLAAHGAFMKPYARIRSPLRMTLVRRPSSAINVGGADCCAYIGQILAIVSVLCLAQAQGLYMFVTLH